jgi:hypothetical protein
MCSAEAVIRPPAAGRRAEVAHHDEVAVSWGSLPKDQVYKKRLGNKKGKENNIENYKMESIHKDILGFLTTFALRITQANSVLNRSLTDSIAGCLSLKMKSFLSIQMHQLKIMIISIKKINT